MQSQLVYSSFDARLPIPVAFSGWKHHLGYMHSSLHTLGGNIDAISITTICEGIGGSVTDVYYGSLYPECIANEVIEMLLEQNVDSLCSFATWLKAFGLDFRLIELSDSSNWVLRMGRFPQRYVHIHPARKSNFSIRIKSTALKSLLAYSMVKGFPLEYPSLTALNEVRERLLKLPPIKEGVLNHQIFTLLKYVNA